MRGSDSAAKPAGGSRIHLFVHYGKKLFLSFFVAHDVWIRSSPPGEKVGLALSRKRSFQIGGLPGIANCASTPVKLFCRDLITKHDREFDQKLSGGGGLRYRLGFLLSQSLVKALQLHVRATGDLSRKSELIPEKP